MRIVRWFITRGILAACLWAGFVHDVQGAKNVGLVLVWLAFALSLVLSLTREKSAADAAKKPRERSMPQWLYGPIDMAVAAFLVWHGYTGAGVCFFIHIGLVAAFAEEVKRQRASLAEAQ